MQTKSGATRIIALMMTIGALTTALTAVAPDGTYHDMSPAVARHIVTVNSTTTSLSPDGTYHDM